MFRWSAGWRVWGRILFPVLGLFFIFVAVSCSPLGLKKVLRSQYFIVVWIHIFRYWMDGLYLCRSFYHSHIITNSSWRNSHCRNVALLVGFVFPCASISSAISASSPCSSAIRWRVLPALVRSPLLAAMVAPGCLCSLGLWVLVVLPVLLLPSPLSQSLLLLWGYHRHPRVGVCNTAPCCCCSTGGAAGNIPAIACCISCGAAAITAAN